MKSVSVLLIMLVSAAVSEAARGGGGGRGGGKGGRGGRRGQYGSRMPILIQHRNPASANYYDHKDVCTHFNVSLYTVKSSLNIKCF